MLTVLETRTHEAIQAMNAKIPEVTLRDIFAMSALNGLIAKGYFDELTSSELSTIAYNIANKMLETRN